MKTLMRQLRRWAPWCLALLLAPWPSLAAEPDAAETKKLHALFERQWEDNTDARFIHASPEALLAGYRAVLDQGALPLATLERLVDEWIDAQLKAG